MISYRTIEEKYQFDNLISELKLREEEKQISLQEKKNLDMLNKELEEKLYEATEELRAAYDR